MAIRINYNPMSIMTTASLAKTDRLMAQVLARLSSGQRIQRSADDPGGMVVANAVRYHRTGVDRAQSNAEEAVTMLQTAEAGMDQMVQVLQRARTLALAAMSTATQDSAQLRALQGDLNAVVSSVSSVATGTTYGSLNLLNGSLADQTLSDEARQRYAGLQVDATRLPGGIQAGSTMTIGAATDTLTRPYLLQSYGPDTDPATPAFFGSGSVTITGPKGTAVLPLAPDSSIKAAVAAINAASSTTGVIADYDQTTGDLRVESTSFGDSTLSILSDIGGFLDGGVFPAFNQFMDLEWIDAQGIPQLVTLMQDPTSPGGLSFTNVDGDPSGPPFTSYAPGAFTLTVLDRSGGGVGAAIAPALPGLTATRTGTTAFQIGSLSSQRVTVEIPDLRSGALGFSAGLAASGFGSLDDLVSGEALINGNAQEALLVIDAALAELLTARGAVGALQGNTIERVMESLRTSSVNLQEYESILRDVDIAKESAEFARVQVMMQAATAMLAQANQVPQTVLQLLK